MATPIKLGSAAGTSLIFTTGSKITTNDSGVQSVSITALYGDGQNVFSVLPAAGTPFNEVFGNTYLPSDFKVDITGGGFDIEYIEGKAAKVTINFKRPDPTQQPGPNGQRSRKVSLATSVSYKNLASYSIIGFAGGSSTFGATIGGSQDASLCNFGFPEPVVTVTYNIDVLPGFSESLSALFAKPGDSRLSGFPSANSIFVPFSTPAFKDGTITYTTANEIIQDGPLDQNYTYFFNLVFDPNPLGWRLSELKWEPHADSTFFDVTETWQNFYTPGPVPTFVSRAPRR